MIISLPIRTRNMLNARSHWSVRARINAAHRLAAKLAVQNAGMIAYGFKPYKIELVRIAPRAMDYDGLVASMKPIVDGIADAWGINDRDISALYTQRKGRPKEYGVIISTEEK